MPEYLVSGHIWYRLAHSRCIEAEDEEHARELWENPPLDFEVNPDTLEYDDSEVESVTEVEPEDANLLCPHCGGGADVYDRCYCENCGSYRDTETAAYCQEHTNL